MRFFFPALVCLLVAAPVHATGGVICRTAGSRPIEAFIVISHTIVPSVVSVRLLDSGRYVPVHLAQSWLSPSELRLDLVDLNAVRHELRLRVDRKGRMYEGSLWRAGERRWARCREG